LGLPLAVGAKAAKPEAQVICLHGDGSFGQNAMELDTAVRHKLPLRCVISLNGGWTADPEGDKPGRYLGYTRYDKDGGSARLLRRICRGARGHPPGLAARVEEGRRGHGRLCQRQTDYRARATTVPFSSRET
jgi:Thiamine pyrophosphate enzyme, C-terminal TPP binding domain